MFDLGSLVYEVEVDSKSAVKNLKTMDKSLKDFGTNAAKVGRSLTKNVTVPIIAALGVAVKLAADNEVALRKFSGAFRGAEEEANLALENLTDNFNLAKSEAVSLMSFTGDLLKGFGATAAEASSLAERSIQLAAAISASSGESIERTSTAVTKALLGERESLKLLGVSILEVDVKNQLLADGTADLTGEALKLARSEATLTIAYRQSADAVANYADNQDTLLAQANKLKGQFKDIAVELGTTLIPLLKDMVETIQGGVKWFSELDEGTKKNIVNLALLAAAIGPVISIVGKAVTAIKALKVALAGPVGLGVAAGVVAVGGIVALGKAIDEADADKRYEKAADEMKRLAAEASNSADFITEFSEQTGISVTRSIELAEEQGLITDEIQDQVDLMKDKNKEELILGNNLIDEQRYTEEILDSLGRMVQSFGYFGSETENANYAFNELSGVIAGIMNNFDISERHAYEIAAAAGITDKYYKSALVKMEEKIGREDQYAKKVIETIKAEREAAAAELKEEEELAKTVSDFDAARAAALAKYTKDLADANTKMKLGLITEDELLEMRVDANEKYIDSMIDAGETSEEVLSSYIENAAEHQEALERNIALKQEAEDLDEAHAEMEKERDQNALRRLDDRLDAEAAAILKIATDAGQLLEDREALESEWTARMAEQSNDRFLLLTMEKDEAIDIAEQLGRETYDIEEYYAEEFKKLQLDKMKDYVNIVRTGLGQIESIYDNLFDTQMNNIDNEYNTKIENIDKEQVIEDARQEAETELIEQQREEMANLTEEKIEQDEKYTDRYNELVDDQLKEVLKFNKKHKKSDADYYEKYNELMEEHGEELLRLNKEKIDMDDEHAENKEELLTAQGEAHEELLNNELIGEEEYNDEVGRLEEEAAQAKYEIEMEAYNAKKWFSKSQVIIDGAVAVMKGYADLGPIGGTIAAAIIAGLSLTQLNLIDSQPPPTAPDFKKFADGGFVNNPGPGVKSIVGEAGPEVILPLNDETLGVLGRAISASTTKTSGGDEGTGMTLNIVIEGLGTATIPITQDALNNELITVPVEAIV